MAFGSDAGAVLSYVTRVVRGDIVTESVKFNEKERKNVVKTEKVTDPVIVFFPSGNCNVLSMKQAEKLGFLRKPSIMNFEAVTDENTIAGKFKYAFDTEEKARLWTMLEESLIQTCIRKCGVPLPRDAAYDENSLFVRTPKHEEAA